MAYDNVKQNIEEFTTAKKNFEKKMKGIFNELFQEFFNNYPEVKAVGWTQYTPYFNDGEPCVFGLGDIYFIAPEPGSDEDMEYNISDISSNDLYDMERDSFYKPLSPYAYKRPDSYKEDIAEYEQKLAANPRYGEVCNGINEFRNLLSNIPVDIYESSFGDHVSVLATPTGIETEEYDHD